MKRARDGKKRTREELEAEVAEAQRFFVRTVEECRESMKRTRAWKARVLNNPRPLREIADDVRQDWKDISPAAEAQLSLLSRVRRMDEPVDGQGRKASDAVVEFLDLADDDEGWRGAVSRKLKYELHLMLDAYREQGKPS